MTRGRKKKDPGHVVVMTPEKQEIIKNFLSLYDIESTSDIEHAIKDLLGGTIQQMLEAEMDQHLGYESINRSTARSSRRSALATERHAPRSGH